MKPSKPITMELSKLMTRRTALVKAAQLGLSMAAFKSLAGAEGVVPARTASPVGGRTTLLFFDDEALFIRTNVVRRLGMPERRSAYHETLGNCTWGYPGVFRCEDGKWRMIYQAGINKTQRGGGVYLLAESDDGLAWRPRNTEKELTIPGRVAPHQILPEEDDGLLSSVYDDPWPVSPRERYKLLTVQVRHHTTALWTSPDLLHWSRAGSGWQKEAPDPPTFAYWNDVRQCYLLATRPGHGDRRICLSETKDWKTFSRRRLVLQADAEDQPLAQTYGMFVLPYEGYYIGLLWLYYAGAASAKHAWTPQRYLGGKQETYLAYSMDGDQWQRCFHQPLFRNGEPGDPDAGCLQLASMVRLQDGTLRGYASCSTREHGDCPPNDGYIVAYDLRRDGFVFLEAQESVGLVGTRALYWQGGEVEINVATKNGKVRARVVADNGDPFPGYGFEDSMPLLGDDTAWTPGWKSGVTLQNLAGKMIRIDLELTNARLYSIRGNFVLSRMAEIRALNATGAAPVREKGF